MSGSERRIKCQLLLFVPPNGHAQPTPEERYAHRHASPSLATEENTRGRGKCTGKLLSSLSTLTNSPLPLSQRAFEQNAVVKTGQVYEFHAKTRKLYVIQRSTQSKLTRIQAESISMHHTRLVPSLAPWGGRSRSSTSCAMLSNLVWYISFSAYCAVFNQSFSNEPYRCYSATSNVQRKLPGLQIPFNRNLRPR